MLERINSHFEMNEDYVENSPPEHEDERVNVAAIDAAKAIVSKTNKNLPLTAEEEGDEKPAESKTYITLASKES